MGVSPAPRSGRIWSRLRSVRTRITAAVIVLTGLALAGAGVAAYLVESARIDSDIASSMEQEIAEFNRLQRNGVDPETGQPFTSAISLLKAALGRSVPDDNEAFISYWDGEPQEEFPRTEFVSDATGQPYRLSADARLAPAIASVLPQGGSTVLDTPLGKVVMAVQPVADDTTQGAFVVVAFRDLERAEYLDVVRTYALVAGAMLVLVTVGAWLVAGRLLAPVRELRAVAQDISDTDLTRRIPATGNDDLTDLTLTFNSMLDRLEDAFATQRQFLDDAGHELRTPITIVRGHLELVDTSNPQEAAATRALVMDEIDRMSRLVDDLIVLAKARRPGFVTPASTEVGILTDEVADKVRALGQRSWRLDERGEGQAVLDPQRITQALVQLASNATRHTESGDVIAVGSRVEERTVTFWVRDSGCGIDPADQERIFDRFQRVGDHGDGADGGSGLGLSIVSAIAAAHSGSVRVESQPDRGATFTLEIPRRTRP
jgi:signal transduction histidine kinase